MAGFRSVAFWLGLSGPSTAQGGFLTPLPGWNAGGGGGVQGGFLTPLPLWNAGAGVAAVPPDFTPEPVHPPGLSKYRALQRRILEEDELLLGVIMAFLQIKDDRWH